jgi:transcriptional regulator of heat shock response
MNPRQAKLLTAIIDEFIHTAIPVGSKQIIEGGHFCLSCATIRNEMRVLGEEGFLEQPHISAGRIPTAKGYRIYVHEFMDPLSQEIRVQKKFTELKEQYFQRKDQERAYEAVALLSHMTPNVAFATVPHKPQVYYLGLASTLKEPEFQLHPQMASGVVEVLEQRLTDLLTSTEIDDHIQYFIGDEHLFAQIQSCSMLVTRYTVRSETGIIGILGPMRMDYAYNTAALSMARELLCVR